LAVAIGVQVEMRLDRVRVRDDALALLDHLVRARTQVALVRRRRSARGGPRSNFFDESFFCGCLRCGLSCFDPIAAASKRYSTGKVD
jgi:hypothetical protein